MKSVERGGGGEGGVGTGWRERNIWQDNGYTIERVTMAESR